MMYAAGRPARLAFSGPPVPSARWQTPQANTSGLRPVATIVGIFGWSSECQSGAEKRSLACASVYPAVLPGTWRMEPSSGLGLKSGGFTGYAQLGESSAESAIDGHARAVIAESNAADSIVEGKYAGLVRIASSPFD